ncbi:hypothetical protein U1Q18_000589 [Sarracenia purpurea var. burkii]
MATSVVMASDDATRGGTKKDFSGFEEARPENAKESRRRKAKPNQGAQKKKVPQRGMGVAQLERLRMQEGWQTMTDTNLPLQSQTHYFLPTSFPAPIPTPTALSPIGMFGSYGAMNNAVGGLNQNLSAQRHGNGGFSGVGRGFSDNFQADPYGIGASNLSLQTGNGDESETSKELSSTPNMNSYSDHRGLHHKNKKKKSINGENLGFNGTRDEYSAFSPVGGCSFLGFDIGNKQSNNDSSVRARARTNVDQDVEVLAIHRKGVISSGEGCSLMEYEFFPGGKGGCNDVASSNEWDLVSPEASVAVVLGGGEAPSVATTTNSIDLSLKLSC